MNQALLAQVVGLLIQHGPSVISTVQELWAGVKQIQDNHQRPPTDEEIQALVELAAANHAKLPIPE